MSRLEELRDDRGGEALAIAPSEGSRQTSDQSGATFCYQKDFDVFDDFGRYEEWMDEYPEVMLRLCDRTGADADALSGVFDYVPEGLGETVTVVLPQDFGQIPEQRDVSDEETNYTVENVTISIFSFEVNFPDVTGVIRALQHTVDFEDLFRDPDTGLPYSTESYTIEYDASYLGSRAVHGFLSSINPLDEVFFLNLSPIKAPIDGYIWYQQRVQSLIVAGESDHHPLHRDDRGNQLAQFGGIGGSAAGSLAARGGAVAYGRRAYDNMVRSGGFDPYNLTRRQASILAQQPRAQRLFARMRRIWSVYKSAHIGGAVVAGAHAASTYTVASTGYVLGNVYVTPQGGTESATIQLTVN